MGKFTGQSELAGEGYKGAFKECLVLSLLLHSSAIHTPLTVLLGFFSLTYFGGKHRVMCWLQLSPIDDCNGTDI